MTKHGKEMIEDQMLNRIIFFFALACPSFKSLSPPKMINQWCITCVFGTVVRLAETEALEKATQGDVVVAVKVHRHYPKRVDKSIYLAMMHCHYTTVARIMNIAGMICPRPDRHQNALPYISQCKHMKMTIARIFLFGYHKQKYLPWIDTISRCEI